MTNETPHAPETNDPLETLLREADEYVPDNGFTERVLTSLPAPRNHAWRRLCVLGSALLVSGALVAWQWPAVLAALSLLSNRSSASHWHALIVLAPVLAALASLVWALLAIAGEED